MNKKLLHLSQHLLNTYKEPTQEVNISAGGAAFQSSEALNKNESLKLKIILHPFLQGFICTAKVILCRYLSEENKGLPYRISVQFLDLDETNQQLLQRYVLQHQAEKLKST